MVSRIARLRAPKKSRQASIADREPDIPRPDRILNIVAEQYDHHYFAAALEGKLSAEEYIKLEEKRIRGYTRSHPRALPSSRSGESSPDVDRVLADESGGA